MGFMEELEPFIEANMEKSIQEAQFLLGTMPFKSTVSACRLTYISSQN